MVINYASILFLYFTIYYLRHQVYESDSSPSRIRLRFKQGPYKMLLLSKDFNLKETLHSLNYFSFILKNHIQTLLNSTSKSLLNFIIDPKITNYNKVVNPS